MSTAITVTVNERVHELQVDPGTLLVHLLRETL